MSGMTGRAGVVSSGGSLAADPNLRPWRVLALILKPFSVSEGRGTER